MGKDAVRELGFGFCGGLVGQTLCHPFDTVKTRLQKTPNYSFIKDIRTNGPMTLYRGLPSPLLSVIIEKSVLFSSYDLIRNNSVVHLNPFSSGILAGIMTTFTVTPFERIKVRSQIHNQPTLTTLRSVIRNDGIASLYRGWTATLFREVPGYGLYFATYEAVKKANDGVLTPAKAFLTGSACGVVAWTFIYPSDPLKTIMQNNNCSARMAFQEIWQAQGIRGFYRGFSWGIARAAILHGGVFLGYETVKNLTKTLGY